MRIQKLIPLFMGLSTAVALPNTRHGEESNPAEDIIRANEIDPSLGGAARTDTVPYDGSSPDLQRRNPPITEQKLVSAVGVAEMPAEKKRGDKRHVFYRGDSRPPEVIFRDGFAPQGQDMSLQRHLNFAGSSGYVSVSRSPKAASTYAFGRTGSKQGTGFVYVISPHGLPPGHYFPDKFPKDQAVQFNREFAVAGPVPPGSIQAVIQLDANNAGSKGKRTKNQNFKYTTDSCSVMKRSECVRIPPQSDNELDKVQSALVLPKQAVPSFFERIMASKTLDWLAELDLEVFADIGQSLRNGSITWRDCQMGLKRALSVTVEKRYGKNKGVAEALTTLKNVMVDISEARRTGVTVALLEDVISELPAIAREIHLATGPAEKLAIANRDIHEAVRLWSKTLVGHINEFAMVQSAKGADVWAYFLKGSALIGNGVWKSTPLGAMINYIYPLENILY
ncbi:hypothetical protein O9K51_08363 [Purpureocillium lavendulum]|uniref:Pierisin-like domain-containing protein n=1 Tax=Purpureocillium lavendulum TaxID=1247861 RepID=A0AB34FJD5_9HYPO|nr:hypothetical protein O9K51_08363 [Purpureocillium lavendulum]